MMQQPKFIHEVNAIHHADYPGYLARCQFFTDDYQDEDFSRTAIMLPASIASAVNKRKAEYLAGRFLCRLLLRKAGIADGVIASDRHRAPCFPAGITGSISHSKSFAVCAISNSQQIRATGIDVETIITQQTADEIMSAVVSETELAYLLSVNGNRPLSLTLAFSAKESLFKALHPLTDQYFGFLDASVFFVDQQQRQFTLLLKKTLNSSFIAGDCFTGHYFYYKNTIITLIYF